MSANYHAELERWAVELLGITGQGEFRNCRCPYHDDSTASGRFSVSSAVFKCQASTCGVQRFADQMAAELNLPAPPKRPEWAAKLEEREEKKRKPSANEFAKVSEYVYTLADGTPHLRVEKLTAGDRKKFPQSHWDGSTWKSGLAKGFEHVLFRLPELMAKPDAPVIVTEGEKDALAAERLGYAATTAPGGAGKAHLVKDWSALAGRDVTVIADNDEAGQKHAAQVAGILLPIAKPVRVLTMPGVPAKGDLYDWIAAGGTGDKLRELISEAEQFIPAAQGGIGLSALEEWELPLALGKASLPLFPLDIFAPWARDYLEALSSTLKTPPDFGGMFFLGGLAITNQKRFRLLVKMGWKEPLPLWVLVAASSGSRKSQAFKEVMRPWANWETWVGEEFAPIRKRATRQIKDLTNEIEQLKKKKAPSTLIAEKEEELDGLFVPAIPRLYTGTGTPEAIETKLGEHGGRYALANAESDILSVMMGKYRSGGTPPIEGFLSAYSGEPLKSDYQTRADVNVPEAHLSMVLATQPDNAADLYSRQKLASRGALARFLTVLPVTSGRMTWDEERVSEEVERAYLEGVAKLLPTFAEVSEQYCSGSSPTRELRFSSPAKRVFSAFFERVEAGKAVGGDLQFLEDWAAKLCGQCARIAALLHLSDTLGEIHLEVSKSAVDRAVHLAESYLIPHAKAVFGFESVPQIEKVWSVLHSHGPEMTRKELNRAVKPMAAPDIDAALESLEERHFIRIDKRPTGKSGKPPTFILVNPNALPPGTNGTNPLIGANPIKSTKNGHSEEWHLLGTNSALITSEASNGALDQLVGNKCPISATAEMERNPSNKAVLRISGISGISARGLDSESFSVDNPDPPCDGDDFANILELPL